MFGHLVLGEKVLVTIDHRTGNHGGLAGELLKVVVVGVLVHFEVVLVEELGPKNPKIGEFENPQNVNMSSKSNRLEKSHVTTNPYFWSTKS